VFLQHPLRFGKFHLHISPRTLTLLEILYFPLLTSPLPMYNSPSQCPLIPLGSAQMTIPEKVFSVVFSEYVHAHVLNSLYVSFLQNSSQFLSLNISFCDYFINISLQWTISSIRPWTMFDILTICIYSA
jgi:hypothetical protein